MAPVICQSQHTHRSKISPKFFPDSVGHRARPSKDFNAGFVTKVMDTVGYNSDRMPASHPSVFRWSNTFVGLGIASAGETRPSKEGHGTTS